jgi:hypothetical protein
MTGRLIGLLFAGTLVPLRCSGLPGEDLSRAGRGGPTAGGEQVRVTSRVAPHPPAGAVGSTATVLYKDRRPVGLGLIIAG